MNPRRPICALVLAAGASTRFGPENKLLVETGGIAILERVVRAVTQEKIGKTIVVAGSGVGEIVSLLSGHPVEVIHNKNWREGMGKSLAVGAGMVEAPLFSGILVTVGDLPDLERSIVEKIIDDFIELKGKYIVAPTHRGRRGHPVVFPVHYLSELVKLTGDRGAKSLLAAAGENLREVEVNSAGIFKDVDKPTDL